MKHSWSTLLWELWAVQAAYAAAAFWPGSRLGTDPALALPGLVLAAAVPAAWALWAVYAATPAPLPPEQPLCPVRSCDCSDLWEAPV